MKYLITYGNEKYERQKKNLIENAKKSNWFDEAEYFGPENLDKTFSNEFKNILNLEKGAGYWIWKPYIIYNKLKQLSENDILIYIDAGCELNIEGYKRFNEYIKILENSKKGILSFQLFDGWKSNIPLLEKNWNNQFIFDYFNIDINSEIANTPQLIGGLLIMKKCENVIKIFRKMLDILYEKSHFFTDSKRHDQSILSILMKIYGTESIPDETYFKNNTKYHPLGWNDPLSKLYPFHAKRIRK